MFYRLGSGRAVRRLAIWAIAPAGFAAAYLYHPTVVVGSSMMPTLRPGQLIWLDRAAYRWRPPRTGEVVVFRRGNAVCVKRVYRGPGETLHCVARGPELLWVVREPLADAVRKCRDYSRIGQRVESRRVPDDCVWVVGDNGVASEDSRHYGPIPIRSILGRARVRRDYTPLLRCEFTPVRPRAVPRIRRGPSPQGTQRSRAATEAGPVSSQAGSQKKGDRGDKGDGGDGMPEEGKERRWPHGFSHPPDPQPSPHPLFC